MKISVIVPAYNEEKYIKEALEALLKQSYSDFEVIVVNNASIDKTVEIAETFPVKVLTEHRKGTQWARECGRKEATGEIIVNMDADCVPDPDWLQNGVKEFEKHSCIAVSGPYDYYDAPPLMRTFSFLTQAYVYTAVNRFVQFFHLGAVIIGGNVFIKREALQKMGGYNTSITFYGDDPDTGKRLAKIGKVIYSKNVIMKSSARRLKGQGFFRITWLYLFHFFKSLVKKE